MCWVDNRVFQYKTKLDRTRLVKPFLKEQYHELVVGQIMLPRFSSRSVPPESRGTRVFNVDLYILYYS